MHKPVILLGHGIRAAGAAHLAPRLLELGVPVLASWQAKDLVDNTHPMFMGCPGIYGTRAANKALYEASEILAIGNRLAIWNVGYEGIRPDQHLVIVSLDKDEARRYPNATWIREDCKHFLERMSIPFPSEPHEMGKWRSTCLAWKTLHTMPEDGTHNDSAGYINSYRFFEALGEHLEPDAHITIDCGAACASAFQMLHVKPPMRLLSSGGLGEMGCALPAAIGASFALDKGHVICIVGDGALMMNLQELQTIVHHDLPVKIIVASNDGYLMLKHTQKNSGMPYSGVDKQSGVSCPHFTRLAYGFGMQAADIYNWEDFHRLIPAMLTNGGPALIEYHMAPEQPCVPKLGYEMREGRARYARFDQMSPES